MSELEFAQRLTSLEGKVDNANNKMDTIAESLHDLKIGIGQRVEQHGEKIAVIGEKVSVLSKVAWMIFTPIISAIVLAILALVMKK